MNKTLPLVFPATFLLCVLLPPTGPANAQVNRNLLPPCYSAPGTTSCQPTYLAPSTGLPRQDIFGNRYLDVGSSTYKLYNGQPIVRYQSGYLNAATGRYVSNFDKTPQYSGNNYINRFIGRSTPGSRSQLYRGPYSRLTSYSYPSVDWKKRRQDSVRNYVKSLPPQYQRHPAR